MRISIRYSLLPKLRECLSANSVVRTNNVFYGSGAVARYEVCIKRDHRHSAILSLRVDYALISRMYHISFFRLSFDRRTRQH